MRIVVGTWMIRYPMGGILSWSLQWLVGFQRLGHEVYLVEKGVEPNSCFDPEAGTMSNDGSYGIRVVTELLTRYGLSERWCFVDADEQYFGLSRLRVEAVISSADLFVDLGTHGAWLEEAAQTGIRIVVDGEPGFRQMKMELAAAAGEEVPSYDFYYTNGANIGTDRSTAPVAGKEWRPVFNPVVTDLFPLRFPAADAPFTTVMNWQAHQPLFFNGKTFGQKDMEFARFLHLPRLCDAPMEMAVAGAYPRDQLLAYGWRLRSAHGVTVSLDSYLEYLSSSAGEFSVCKNVFVATNSGWFSDRSAAYLASGRPVVLQDTGFSVHLPCGRGLFAVRTAEDAATAIDIIRSDYRTHSGAAREVSREYLDASVILARLLDECGR